MGLIFLIPTVLTARDKRIAFLLQKSEHFTNANHLSNQIIYLLKLIETRGDIIIFNIYMIKLLREKSNIIAFVGWFHRIAYPYMFKRRMSFEAQKFKKYQIGTNCSEFN